MNSFFRYFLIVILIGSFLSCAKRGRPTGGPKDEDKPLFVVANPPYESLNFTAKKIKITFNEYVRLKNVNKQLVVSPPLKYPPLISPQGTASKEISIQILDTLQPNTTYTFDFGNSVEDNNEGNKLERFKYVFSTGTYIDSLTTRGSIKDAFFKKPEEDIKLLLYRIDSSFTDSIIYKQKPNYVTSTLDSTIYNFSNLQEGKYLLIGLKDKSSDYIFAPKEDKIGFYNDTVVLPRDSILNTPISLFKEILPYDFKKAKEVRKGKLLFSYQGDAKDMELELLSKVPDNFKSISRFEKGRDTLNYWHSLIDADSLNFLVRNKDIVDTVTVRLRKKKLDSLSFSSAARSILELKDTFYIDANNPIISLDTSKVSLVDKDTVNVPYQSFISNTENKLGFIFKKGYKQRYTLSILPKAIRDIYNLENDSLNYIFGTKDLEDYGAINLRVNNPNSKNLIVELTYEDGSLIYRKFTNSSTTLQFPLLIPKSHLIRVIIDKNNNGKWDTGDFLKRIQPEEIIYYDQVLKVRSNFTYDQSISIN
ncbi:Ig-like domain-containing protein [Flavobacteriaceae bacterium S356]|uniref:Ig-like domain-containing protein n=1 Tax=Asprobacillus argus TaxID=3076534 RepID=A0ABU3LBH2_9FLAO|nr:Ig-like domain-containing protein [Flavobacteriaceae bacterium S356]